MTSAAVADVGDLVEIVVTATVGTGDAMLARERKAAHQVISHQASGVAWVVVVEPLLHPRLPVYWQRCSG